MSDWKRLSGLAIVFLVVVRMAIGWQFVYEGLWKLDSQQTAKPWTSAGYLKNSRGPLRGFFRNMAGDPDDLDWLDYDKVAARWDAWRDRFVAHHPDLDDRQKQRLNALLDGPPEFRAELTQMPEGVKFGGSLARVARFDPQIKRLIVDGQQHLIPAERDAMLGLVKVEEDPAPENVEKNAVAKAYQQAVRQVYSRSSRLSIKEQALVLLKGDPERATQIYEEHKGTVDHKRIGNIELYQTRLARYERDLAAARTEFQHDHLKKQWAEIQQLRADLVGPVKALDADFKKQARELLTPAQLARGPVPEPMTRIAWIDQLTMWSLVVIGGLLMVGLFSRLSAVAAAGLLLSFYLAMPPPPWPGVTEFQELPGPEHSYLIDKNLIEVFALLAIALLPTGRWFGIDAIFGRRRRKQVTEMRSDKTAKPKPAERAPSSTPSGKQEKVVAQTPEPAESTTSYKLKNTS